MIYRFISDLHLDHDTPAHLAAFSSLLARSKGLDGLFILGDLFEMWIGDDDRAPLAEVVCQSLKALERDCPVWIQHGNRDFLLGQVFAERSGANLLSEQEVIEADGQRIVLLHGDVLCTDDNRYQAFRSMVRSEAWQREVLSRPLEERQALGRSLRAGSRQAQAGLGSDILDANPAAIDALAVRIGAGIMIHGHTHRPGIHLHAWGRRIVLGAWERCGWYLDLELPDGRLRLARFPI